MVATKSEKAALVTGATGQKKGCDASGCQDATGIQ